MISEGWDYPELGILVMARPTLSKVLYLQQIGRGLRKTSTKKNVFVIDVVDEYGAMARPCSMHSIFQNTMYVPFGNKNIYMFSPKDVVRIREELQIPEHTEETIKKDFFDFLEERDYSLSYKMPFMLSFLKHINSIGDAKIEDVLTDYIAFYENRIANGLPVDRPTCPYNENTLKDRKMIKANMLTNPFEKFERKRFLYQSKDLGVISMNHALFSRMEENDFARVKKQMLDDLENYYRGM